MTDSITFQLGPATVRVEGDHFITRWAMRTYQALACEDEPAVTFSLVDHPVHISGPETVGDSKNKVGPGRMFCRLRHFDVRILSRDDRLQIDLFPRDRRGLFVRSLVDPEEAWKMWLSHGSSLNTHLLKAFAYEVFPFVVQCALLRRRAAFVHAAGFELDGRGVLMPAWGGVGKSTAVAHAVLHGRARFVADDHTVIDADGGMHLHMLPIHAYAYHARQDPLVRQRLMAAFGRGNRLQWRFANVVRRKRAVRWVSPKDMFGPDNLARHAKIEQVVVMFRSDRDDFVWEPISAADAARPCTAVILEEVNDFCDRLALAGAGWAGSNLPGLAEACASITETYEAAFSQAECARLLVPRRAGGEDLTTYLEQRVPLMAEAADRQPAPPTR